MLAVVVALVGTACARSATEVACSEDGFLPPLAVTVTDSASGALVPDAVVIAAGPTADSVSIGANVNDAYPARLGGLAGVYTVTVRAAGYLTWAHSETVTASVASCGRGLVLAVEAQLQASR